MPIEFDNNATTRPHDRVIEAMSSCLRDAWHNPSSVHRAGQDARHAVEQARRAVAELIGVAARDLTFTSGATESIALGLRGILLARTEAARGQRDTVVTTPIEHEAVRDQLGALLREGLIGAVRELPLTPDGVVCDDALDAVIDERVAIVCCQWANNETGAIQPVGPVGEAAHRAGAIALCDATQWVGKMPTAVRTRSHPGGAPIDVLACSAHKMHGPKGVGALYLARTVPFRPLVPGTQERERRGGTEATPAIVGFGIAAELAQAWLADPRARERMASMRDDFERTVLRLVPDAVVHGPTAPAARLWNTTNIGFPRLEAEALLLRLSERGLHASAGAACSSGSLEPSPVLLAMGVEESVAHGALRFSISRETTREDITRGAELVGEAVMKLREIGV